MNYSGMLPKNHLVSQSNSNRPVFSVALEISQAGETGKKAVTNVPAKESVTLERDAFVRNQSVVPPALEPNLDTLL